MGEKKNKTEPWQVYRLDFQCTETVRHPLPPWKQSNTRLLELLLVFRLIRILWFPIYTMYGMRLLTVHLSKADDLSMILPPRSKKERFGFLVCMTRRHTSGMGEEVAGEMKGEMFGHMSQKKPSLTPCFQECRCQFLVFR